MFSLNFDPIQIPIYSVLWTAYATVWRWLWKDIRQAWRGAYGRGQKHG